MELLSNEVSYAFGILADQEPNIGGMIAKLVAPYSRRPPGVGDTWVAALRRVIPDSNSGAISRIGKQRA